TIEECMELMTEKRIRHLPVLEKDQLIGMVTIGDIVNNMISSQKFTISELKNYISGGYAG
ncbi:MAG: CBS domain-containing protein, partial [Candidatus Pacebacteria bacterium]|nr:CBS domain-containing protein [Candidatus Paceibacterota bacterium]